MAIYRRAVFLTLALALLSTCSFLPKWHVSAAETHIYVPRPQAAASTLSRHLWLDSAQQASDLAKPGPTIEAYIRPEFAHEMRSLRPAILAAARRHNHPALSRMTDEEFASVIVLLLYNENFGKLEERVAPLRALTPLYQDLQMKVNETGADLSVWPANLRPSVALEILRDELPTPTGMITIPIHVAGNQLQLDRFSSQQALYAALNNEISKPSMAVEYLAANLERGVYRAQLEDVPVTWRALAAWHNQGIVNAHDIRTNPTARDYVRRTASYLPAARALIATPTECHYLRCGIGDAEEFGEDPARW
jgi:hypothetical protein